MSNTDLVCQTLEIVGAYIAWINIDLIANIRFVDLLVRFLREQPLREAAADCLHDIVAKGMDPVAKTKLVESLFSVLDSAGILNVDMVNIYLRSSLYTPILTAMLSRRMTLITYAN